MFTPSYGRGVMAAGKTGMGGPPGTLPGCRSNSAPASAGPRAPARERRPASGGPTGLAGKRVGVVGTGATGVQGVPKPAENAPDHEWFHAACTPGYCNGEGRGRPNGPTAYPHGAFAFHELLRRWREESVGDVLRARTSARG
ncbi:hypothetical protein GCM10010182_33440 [Actinomadura cremea]|nr:hypothetical protein GCM10010182_33440 [Actinomadura cremea]